MILDVITDRAINEKYGDYYNIEQESGALLYYGSFYGYPDLVKAVSTKDEKATKRFLCWYLDAWKSHVGHTDEWAQELKNFVMKRNWVTKKVARKSRCKAKTGSQNR